MKKVKPNYGSDRTKELISYLQKLEDADYFNLSEDGKNYLDKIWKLLDMPTNKELQAALDAKNKKEEEE